jgi:energy-coupling factor transport system permease protein
MNARALIVWSLAGLVVALSTTNPIYRALIALIAVNVLRTWSRPEQDLRFLVRAIAFTTVGAIFLNVAVGHLGDTTFFSLPDGWPVLGGPWTLESIAYGFDAALGLAAAVLVVAPLSYVLEPAELVDALPKFLERAGIVVAAALNLVPGIGRSFGQVRDAQTMRGWRPAGVRSWADVIVPVAITAVEGSLELAEAMESRAFGSGPRSRYAPRAWTLRDSVVVVVSVAAIVLSVWAQAAGVAADWYPYPSLSIPPVSPAMFVAALLPAVAIWP